MGNGMVGPGKGEQVPHAAVNGIELFYEEQGQGPPVVLIHGIMGAPRFTFANLLHALTPHFRVILPDTRGFGRTRHPKTTYHHAASADDLAGLIQHLGVAPAHVIGHGMGGIIAQNLALRHPQAVKSLVLLSTGSYVHKSFAEYFQRKILDYYDKFKDDGMVGEYNLADDPINYLRWAEQAITDGSYADTRERLPQIGCRVLVVHGELDEQYPVAHARLFKERLPRCRLEILPGRGHVLFFEAPELLAQAILSFLHDLEAASPSP